MNPRCTKISIEIFVIVLVDINVVMFLSCCNFHVIYTSRETEAFLVDGERQNPRCNDGSLRIPSESVPGLAPTVTIHDFCLPRFHLYATLTVSYILI
jgi:hypothetical protein